MTVPESEVNEAQPKKYQTRDVKRLIVRELDMNLVTAYEKLDLTKFVMYDLWEQCPKVLRLAVSGFKSSDKKPNFTSKDFATYCFTEVGYTDDEISKLLHVNAYTLAKWWNSQRKVCMQYMLKALPPKPPVGVLKSEYVDFIKNKSNLGVEKAASALGVSPSELAVIYYEHPVFLSHALQGIRNAPDGLHIELIDGNLSNFTKKVAKIKTNELCDQIKVLRKQLYTLWNDPLKRRLVVYAVIGFSKN